MVRLGTMALFAVGLYGCGMGADVANGVGDLPADENSVSEPVVETGQTDDQGVQAIADDKPWIVLSDFKMESGGLNNTATVRYEFAQGRPDDDRKCHWFVEEMEGAGFVTYWDEPFDLDPAGGTLTMEVGGTIGRDQVYTFIAVGPRSTTYSDPEPDHISGKLYLGQDRSVDTPIASGEEPPPVKVPISAVLSNSRHEPSDEGDLIAIDYTIEQLPEAAGFWLDFVGAEGGSVSYDVEAEIRAAPESGTLRRPVPNPDFLDSPYEVRLKCQPFGAETGSSLDTVTISNTIKVE